MTQELKQGDTVEWNTPQGTTRGTVKKWLTSETEVGGQKVKASNEDPRYLVESEKSGKEAAHKPDALTKIKEPRRSGSQGRPAARRGVRRGGQRNPQRVRGPAPDRRVG